MRMALCLPDNSQSPQTLRAQWPVCSPRLEVQRPLLTLFWGSGLSVPQKGGGGDSRSPGGVLGVGYRCPPPFARARHLDGLCDGSGPFWGPPALGASPGSLSPTSTGSTGSCGQGHRDLRDQRGRPERPLGRSTVPSSSSGRGPAHAWRQVREVCAPSRCRLAGLLPWDPSVHSAVGGAGPCACRVAPACCKTVTLERLRARGGWGQAIQQGRGQASIWHHTRGCALGVLPAGWAMVQTPAVRPQPQCLPGDLPVLCDGPKLSGAQSGLQSLGVGPESRWASCSRPGPLGSPPGCPATHHPPASSVLPVPSPRKPWGGVRPCFCSPATSQGLVTPQSSAPAHLRLALCWQPSSPSRLRLPTQQPVSCAPSEAWGALSLGRVWEGSGHEERGRTRAAAEETRRAPEVTGSRAVLEAILPGHPHPPSASQGSPSDGGGEGSRRGVLPAASGPPPRRGPYGVPREPYCTQQHLLRLPHGRDPLALRLAPTPSWGPCSLGGPAWGAHPTLLGRPRLQVPRRWGGV